MIQNITPKLCSTGSAMDGKRCQERCVENEEKLDDTYT
jgi:hypothetical protein